MEAEAQDTAEARESRESSQAPSLFARNLVVGPEFKGMQEGSSEVSEPVTNTAGPAVGDIDPAELSAEVPMSGSSCFK